MVNLYPFYDKVTSAGGIEFEDGIENVDIGGPAMIRAAVKVVYLTENGTYQNLNKFEMMTKTPPPPNQH